MNYTQIFQKQRDELMYKQNLVLNMKTITRQEDVKPIHDALNKIKAMRVANNAPEVWDSYAKKSLTDFRKTNLASKGLNERQEEVEVVEKTVDNFWGAVAAQSLNAYSNFIAGEPNALTEIRLSKQLGAGESQGLLDGAVDSVLMVNTATNAEVDAGWLLLYQTSSAFLNKSSLIIIDTMNVIQGQKLKDLEEIKALNPLRGENLKKTKYERYGVAMLYDKMERDLSEHFNSLGGVNGLFAAFRTRMAMDKASEAYKKMCMKPNNVKFIFDGVGLNTELGALASEQDKEYYYAKRFVHNIKQAIKKLRMESARANLGGTEENEGEEYSAIGSNPLIHVLYNPDAAGASIIDVVQEVMARPSSRLSFGARVVFHDSSLVPETGAWSFKYENGAVVRDSRGFERVVEAQSELSFGVMLVAVGATHVYGVNMEYYNMTMENPSTEAIGYFGFERYTHYVDDTRKMWVRNVVPASENQYLVMDN